MLTTSLQRATTLANAEDPLAGESLPWCADGGTRVSFPTRIRCDIGSNPTRIQRASDVLLSRNRFPFGAHSSRYQRGASAHSSRLWRACGFLPVRVRLDPGAEPARIRRAFVSMSARNQRASVPHPVRMWLPSGASSSRARLACGFLPAHSSRCQFAGASILASLASTPALRGIDLGSHSA